MYDLQIYKGVLCYDNKEWHKIWKWSVSSVQNLHEEFDKFWPEHSKISKISTLVGCFWLKYKIFELRKYRGVMFDGTQYWYKAWRKTYLCFQKWHEKFRKFLPEHLKVSKLGLWRHPFIYSRKCMSLKFTEEFYVSWKWIVMQNWTVIDLSVQNWHKEFDEFWPQHLEITKNCTLMGCFWSNYRMFELKIYRGVMFNGTECWCKTWRKTDFAFKTDMRNLANFHQNRSESLKIGTLMGSFYPK